MQGVKARGNSIQLDFTYQGERCRETLRTKPTKTALSEAFRMREAVLHAIAMNKFDYALYFPDSPRAIKYSKNKGSLISIEHALKEWLKRAERRCQYSTLKDYGSMVYYHLIPAFGDLTLTELTLDHIEDWIDSLEVSNKRINNILSPLKQVYSDAFCDGIIEKNPLQRLRLLPITQREPRPFSLNEIQRILNQLTDQSYNLIKFAFWTGLRTSELIGLRWEDIDLDRHQCYVRVAIVGGREKTTKTASGHRTINLNEHSATALRSQFGFTEKKLRVFNDPKTNLPWANDQIIRKRVWKSALNTAGVEYRNPYQTRHTFASMMLSQGKNPMWVAQQMGHKDWGMIRKVYGRWLPNE